MTGEGNSHIAAREPKRRAIIFVFGAFGPLAGVLAVSVVFLASQFGQNMLVLLEFVFKNLWAPYLVGILPALVAGIAYAFAPPAWRRIVLSPFYGAIPSAIAASFLGAGEPLTVAGAAAIVGAGAALICAITVRVMGFDGVVAERRPPSSA